MCQSCQRRAEELRVLALRFEGLAEATPEPRLRQRLAETAADLTRVADRLALRCEAAEALQNDIIWDESTPLRLAAG